MAGRGGWAYPWFAALLLSVSLGVQQPSLGISWQELYPCSVCGMLWFNPQPSHFASPVPLRPEFTHQPCCACPATAHSPPTLLTLGLNLGPTH
jgi:hypothetical protein